MKSTWQSPRLEGATKHALLVSEVPPPTPSICLISGLPKRRRRRAESSASAAGSIVRSRTRHFEVPPLIHHAGVAPITSSSKLALTYVRPTASALTPLGGAPLPARSAPRL